MKNIFLRIATFIILSSILFQFAVVEASINNVSTEPLNTNQLSALNPGETTRVSVASDGTQAKTGSTRPSTSADGRFIAFETGASNLVPNDTNFETDIFVHDLIETQTTRVSIASDGTQANNYSRYNSISSDGRYVAFSSSATNLVPDETQAHPHQVFIRDRFTGETIRITEGDKACLDPQISANGRYVSFLSMSRNLDPDQTGNSGTNNVYLYDIETGQTKLININSEWNSYQLSTYSSISADGQFVAYNTLDEDKVYVHEIQTGNIYLVTVASDGTVGNGEYSFGRLARVSISADGRYVAFESWSSNLVSDDSNEATDVFVHDLLTGLTTRVSVSSEGSEGNSSSHHPSISADGRFVAFETGATNLVPNDTNEERDIFVHDLLTGKTTRVSIASDRTQGNESSSKPSISADGQYVTFSSKANNLVLGDTNNLPDVFVHRISWETGDNNDAYSISGNISISGGNGLEGVTITTQTEQSAVTNSSGDYTISNLSPGTYTLTPSKSGYTFNPSSLSVEITSNNVTGEIFSATPDSDAPNWLLMYYFAGDNDIHDVMFEEMQDIASVENSDIDIAIFHDGCASSGMPTSYQFISSSGENDYVNKGELNSGDGTTLEDFVSWARTKSNAANHALIISDHGHALSGVAWDDTSSFDKIDVGFEIVHAFVQIGHLDVLYMHACLMGNLEFAYLIRGLVDYYVASESISWGSIIQSDYISSITSNTTPEQLAKSMAAANYEFLYQKNDPSTISVLDMSQVDDVATKTNNLALAINTAPDPIKENIWILLASPHSNLQRYDDGQDNNDINDPGDILADLYHSAELIQHLQDVQPEVDLLLSTKDDFVIYEKNWPPNTGPYSKSNGVSIAFPTKPSSFYDGEWIEFAQGADWSFVSNPSSDKLSRDSVFYWGPMVSNLVMIYNPDIPDQSEPPELVPLGKSDSDSDYKIYLTILIK